MKKFYFCDRKLVDEFFKKIFTNLKYLIGMKKLVLNFSFLLFFVATIARAQVKIFYQKKINLEVIKEAIKDVESTKIKEDILAKYGKLTYFSLLYKNDSSVFKEEAFFEKEAEQNLMAEEQNTGIKVTIQENKPIGLYLNYKTGEAFEERNFYGKHIVVQKKITSFNWNLLNEQKQIGNYLCKKATTIDTDGEKIVAWYSEDLSLPIGPSFYGGLPGLIIKLETTSSVYEVISFENLPENTKIEKPKITKKTKILTSEQYEKLNKSR